MSAMGLKSDVAQSACSVPALRELVLNPDDWHSDVMGDLLQQAMQGPALTCGFQYAGDL